MKTRMQKYYDEEGNSLALKESRTNKNEELYNTLMDGELSKLDITNNYEVIGDNDDIIDIDKIRKIVDNRYNAPKKKKIDFDLYEEDKSIDLNDTKEYDLNAVMSKARENKVVDYEKERLKKIRDTQFDILSNLDLNEEAQSEEEEEIINLMNTIANPVIKEDKDNEESNEEKKNTSLEKDLDPLDILSDLKGDDNTVKIEGITEAIKKEEQKPKEVKIEKMELEDNKKDKKVNNKQSKKKKEEENFYTTQTIFDNTADYDDFNDLKEDVKMNQILIKIIVFVIIVLVIVGGIILANKFLDLGLF
ncbi:MAG: hypothetical protein IJ574_05290 [Bacilli bacterium]|nr:hypothetical protein [Bacilli bacterium]